MADKIDMILTTPERMRDLDNRTIRDYKIPGLLLMENAASAIAGHILERSRQRVLRGLDRERVLIVCGKGNNGGDGFAAARKLHEKGLSVTVLALTGQHELKGDALANLQICLALRLDVVFAAGEAAADVMTFCLARVDLIVDAIFGTGFSGKPEGIYKMAIDLINEIHKPVIAIDTPSGLDGNFGTAPGACIRAEETLALGLVKIGLIVGPASEMAGTVIRLDIGLPRELVEQEPHTVVMTEESLIRNLLPKRFKNSHKGNYGKVMAVTGSPGMTGAGCLLGNAAYRAGAGLVYMTVPGSLSQIYEMGVHEAITLCAGNNTDRFFSAEGTKSIIDYSNNIDVVAIGPGLSTEVEVMKAVRKLVSGIRKPMVLDADALTAIAADLPILSRIKAEVVLTPHEGEMARLAATSTENISLNRLDAARQFARKWNVTVVLKGWRTIIALPDGKIFVNPTGNPGMATAGAGDVLSGILAALIGGGMCVEDAAIVAVYLHGKAGDLAAEALGEISLKAGDLVDYLPMAIQSVQKGDAEKSGELA